MSPLIALLALALLLGVVVFIIGLIKKRKQLILIGAPALCILFVWLILASTPPDAEEEFDRLFGTEHRIAATDIQTIKPILMDGHFISFRIPEEEFNEKIKPKLLYTFFTNGHLLRDQDLPSGWPESVKDATSAWSKEVGKHAVLVCYDQPTQSAYASVQYDKW